MLLVRLWNYIRGYVIILVEGYFLEKFINICIRRQIFLWDIKRQKNGIMTLKVSINGFRLLRPIARKTRCRVRILRKRGLPFVLNRYKGRKTFALGAVIFMVLIYILSSFIWTIEIKGNNKLDSQLLVDKLASYGVRPGAFKYRIDADRVVNNMMLNVQELAWIGIEVKGTKVKIEVAERVKPPSIIPKDKPCNIVARRDGIIKSIVAKAGQDMVKAGATVKQGDILISGSVPNKDVNVKPKLVHAIGTVKARTWYESSSPVNTQVIEKQRSGEKKDIYSLVLLARRITLFPVKISFENYDKIEIKKGISIGEDLVFPFEFIIDRYYENNLIQKEISLDEAKQAAAENAYREASGEIPADAEVVKNYVEFNQDNNGQLLAVITIECTEDIGVTEDIKASQTSAAKK